MDEPEASWTAFEGTRRIASGALADVVTAAKATIDGGSAEPVMVLDDLDAQRVEIDFRNGIDFILARLPRPAPKIDPEAPRGRGRPRMGVVAREITLLPRHWDWLNRQPGGASVALRKLVEQARRSHDADDRRRRAHERAYHFMSALAGDLPGYEEATRALFADDPARLRALIAYWPEDVREHALMLAAHEEA